MDPGTNPGANNADGGVCGGFGFPDSSEVGATELLGLLLGCGQRETDFTATAFAAVPMMHTEGAHRRSLHHSSLPDLQRQATTSPRVRRDTGLLPGA